MQGPIVKANYPDLAVCCLRAAQRPGIVNALIGPWNSKSARRSNQESKRLILASGGGSCLRR